MTRYTGPELKTINPVVDGTFARASTAYLYDPAADTMTESESGERRLLTVPVVTPAEITLRTTEGGGSSTLKISNYNGSYIFAVDGTNNKIYRSDDGDTWAEISPDVAIASGEFTGPAVMLTLQNNRILRSVPVGDNVWNLYYSDDHGDTWTVCKDVDTPANNYDAKAIYAHWGKGINPTSGTICITTYGGNLTSTIGRSTDNGTTWKKVVSNAGDADHHHALAYHAGTGKWIYNTGDGGNDDFDWVSSDDGLTWEKFGAFSRGGQHTYLMDTGHPTRILCGSDNQGAVHWIDLVTGEYESCLWNWNTVGATSGTIRQYCWLIVKHAGVYYAFNFDSAASGSREAVVSVSNDLITWRTYARLNNNTINGGYAFGGFFNGNLHISTSSNFAATNTWQHLLLKPAEIRSFRGLLTEPAVANIITSANASAGLTTTGWSGVGSGDVLSLDTTVKLFGTSSIKCVDSAPAVGRFMSPRVITAARTAGVKYIGRVFVKGRGGGIYNSTSENGCFFRNSTEPEPYSRYRCGTSRWLPLLSNIFESPAASTAYLYATIFENDDLDGAFRAMCWLDCVQYQTLPPSSWQIAGTNRVAETWSHALTLGTDWTFAFTLIPQFHYTQAGAANLYVCTFEKTDGTDYISVYWNPSDNKWYLDSVGDGSGDAVATAATGFQWEQQLMFCIRRSNGMLRLGVNDGTGWIYTAATADHTAASTGNVTWQVGDHAGANLMPQLLSAIYYYPNASLSDADVESIAWLPSASSSSGGIRGRYNL